MERSLLAPGHRACAGCAMPTTIRLVLDAAGPNTIVVSPTGCLEVVTTPFPESAWCVPWIHSCSKTQLQWPLAWRSCSSAGAGIPMLW